MSNYYYYSLSAYVVKWKVKFKLSGGNSHTEIFELFEIRSVAMSNWNFCHNQVRTKLEISTCVCDLLLN